MKKIISVFIAIVLIVGNLTFPVIAEDNIRVFLDGAEIEFDVPPQIIDNRTLVPMRAIFEAFGTEVFWVDEREYIETLLFDDNDWSSHHWSPYSPAIVVMSAIVIVFQIDIPIMMTINLLVDSQLQPTFSPLQRWVELDVPPQIIDNRTLVPLRAISEALDARVDWDGYTRTITISTENETTYDY